MKNVNSLIAEGKIEDAAEVVYEAFIGMLNTFSPNMNLSKAEYEKVMPAFVEKLLSPAPAEKEATEEPGDDVVVNPGKASLNITFEGPEDDTLFSALKPDDISKEIIVGQKFSVLVPVVNGYTPDKTSVSGTMTEDGVEETVTYSKEVAPTTEEQSEGEGTDITDQEPTSGEGSNPEDPGEDIKD